jgi:hypothetical protein
MPMRVVDVASAHEVADALKLARLPSRARADAFLLEWDDEKDVLIARIAVILDFESWDAAADQVCVQASSAAWQALAPLGVFADVICRTVVEHDSRRGSAHWIPVSPDVDS